MLHFFAIPPAIWLAKKAYDFITEDDDDHSSSSSSRDNSAERAAQARRQAQQEQERQRQQRRHAQTERELFASLQELREDGLIGDINLPRHFSPEVLEAFTDCDIDTEDLSSAEHALSVLCRQPVRHLCKEASELKERRQAIRALEQLEQQVRRLA